MRRVLAASSHPHRIDCELPSKRILPVARSRQASLQEALRRTARWRLTRCGEAALSVSAGAVMSGGAATVTTRFALTLPGRSVIVTRWVVRACAVVGVPVPLQPQAAEKRWRHLEGRRARTSELRRLVRLDHLADLRLQRAVGELRPAVAVHDVGGAGRRAAVVVGVRRTYEHVRAPIAVDVAWPCSGKGSRIPPTRVHPWRRAALPAFSEDISSWWPSRPPRR